MKKIISIILTLCLLLTVIPVSAMADETVSSPSLDKVKLMYGLDLIPLIGYDDFNASRVMTRAELTYFLNNLFEYKNDIEGFDWSFFGDAEANANDLKEPEAYGETRFSDVPRAHWAYEEIEKTIIYGLMQGASETTFEPEETVTIEQFVKCILSIMGYSSQANAYGGYPGGYLKVAGELKILKNIGNNTSGVTYGDVVEILYNCLDVKLYNVENIFEHSGESHVVYSETNETFLNGILGLGRIRGVMTDNSVTSLVGKSILGSNELLVGGVKFKADDKIHLELSEYIGRELDCYYKLPESNNESKNVVYGALTNSEEVTVIDSDKYIRYKDNTIYYEDDAGDEEEVNLSSFYNLIYNGEAKTTYDDTIFNLNAGTIKVIERPDSDTNVVLIENWETIVANIVDANAQKIYNRLENTDLTINLLQYEKVRIFNDDGSDAMISDIPAGTVLDIKKSTNTITIKMSNRAEKVKVEGVASGEGKNKVITTDAEYSIADCYDTYSSKITIKPGQEITIYLNSFNEIAWVEEGATDGLRVGYLVKSGEEKKGITVKTGVVIFDSIEKSLKTYYTNEKRITLSDANGLEKQYKDMSALLTVLGNYSGIVRFKLNAEGYLTYLELPITDSQYICDGKLSLMPDTSGEMYYRFNNFGGKVIMSTSATSLIAVNPLKANSEEGYGVYSHTAMLANEKTYALKCYTTKKGSRLAQYVVYETDAQSSAIEFSYYSDPKIAIVKDVVKGYDEEEGVVTKIKAYCFGFTTSARDETLMLLENVVPTTTLQHPFTGNLEPGDLIVYGLDERGYVNDVRILWDENGTNPAYPTGSKGMLLDSKGYYGTGSDAPTYSSDTTTYTGDMYRIPNPYSLSTSASETKVGNSSTFRAGPFAVFYGYCYNIEDGVAQYTTQDLTVEEFDETGLGGKHAIRIWPKPSGIISVKLKGKTNVEIVSDGNYSANNTLKTAKLNGTDCSRVIILSAACQVFKTIVINRY